MDWADAQFYKLIDAAPDATVVVAESGEIVFASAQVRPVFGYQSDELIGKFVDALLPERFRANHNRHRHTFFQHTESRPMGARLELFGLHKDGTEFPVEVSLSSVDTHLGMMTCSAIRDITDRVKLSERRFRAIFQQKHQLAGIVDLEGILLDVNEMALSLSDIKREDVIGKLFWETEWWIHDLALQARVQAATTSAADGKTAQFEVTIPRTDGSLATVDFSIRPVRDEQDNIVFLVPEGQDVSKRKEAEIALRRSHEQLEARVTQRTLELADTNKQLRQAKEIAESATVAKTRFLAAASHDLRQPLQSIGMYLSVLARQLEQSKDRKILDKIRSSLSVMGELLNALLDISKLENGSITPTIKDFPIRDLLDKVLTANEPQANDKGLTLRCSASPCVIHSDPVLLEHIVENFVTNAIRYTQSGHIEIHCECRGDTARLEVRDSGIGIPADALESIFEEYYQLDTSTHDHGMGLGLAIVKQLAQLLKHPLSVQSTLNQGSTFAVEVPVGQSLPKSVAKPASMKSAARTTQPVVLFIDDDPAIVDATTMLLESEDIQVHSALNGDAALSYINDGLRPDIVVSDYRLPGCNGVEVIRRLREATVGDLPAVLITGDTTTQEIAAASLANYTVLHKPVDTDQLLALIEQVSS